MPRPKRYEKLRKNLGRMATSSTYAGASDTLSEARSAISQQAVEVDKLKACITKLLDNSTVFHSAIEIDVHNKNGFDAEQWEEEAMALLGRTEKGRNA